MIYVYGIVCTLVGFVIGWGAHRRWAQDYFVAMLAEALRVMDADQRAEYERRAKSGEFA